MQGKMNLWNALSAHVANNPYRLRSSLGGNPASSSQDAKSATPSFPENGDERIRTRCDYKRSDMQPDVDLKFVRINSGALEKRIQRNTKPSIERGLSEIENGSISRIARAEPSARRLPPEFSLGQSNALNAGILEGLKHPTPTTPNLLKSNGFVLDVIVKKTKHILTLSAPDSMRRNLRTMTLDTFDTMPFGKYQGELVGTVIEEDPDYIEWLLRETPHRLTEEALEYLKECEK